MLKASKAIFLTLVILPLFGGLLYSLFYSFGLAGVLSKGFTLAHWQSVFQDSSFWKSIAFSFFQAVGGLAFTVIIALSVFPLLKSKKNTYVAPLYLFIPLTMAPIVVAFAFFGLWSDAGFVSRIFYQIGLLNTIQSFPDVVNGKLGSGILLAHLFLGIPFFVISYFNLYKAHKINELVKLSETMGLSKEKAWVKVVVPILFRQSSKQMLLYFVFFFGAYEIPLLLGSESNRMFSILILDKLTKFDISQKPQAYVMASCYLIFMLTGFFLFAKSKKKLV